MNRPICAALFPLLLAACGSGSEPSDAATPTDAGLDARVVDGSSELASTHTTEDAAMPIEAGLDARVVDGSSELTSTYTFTWPSEHLAANCALWGADAKMVIEVDLPRCPECTYIGLRACTTDEIWYGATSACRIDQAWRFEAPCTAGQLSFQVGGSQMPASYEHGWFHVESTRYPAPPRHVISQNPDAPHNLYAPTGVAPPPNVVDGGTEAGTADTSGNLTGCPASLPTGACLLPTASRCKYLQRKCIEGPTDIYWVCRCDGVWSCTPDGYDCYEDRWRGSDASAGQDAGDAPAR